MPELPVDAAVANRFISSLSKSLQALCHGCMDFDTGIRIVGYINVDIDSGGAVDYVLNEKVSKGANNSISFTSNSYVSKKDQPKQTRDGSCSPVAELNVPPYSGHQRGSQPYQTHPSHSRYPYTTQSHVLRGAHKRSWAGSGGWRGSPKKQSRGRGIYANQPHYPSQDTHYQNTPDSFLQPDQPPGSNNGTDMNVKKEALDSDEQGDNMNNLNNQDAETRVNIKTDPDAATGGLSGDPSLDGSESTNNFVEQPPDDLQSRTEGDASAYDMPPPGSSSSNYNSGQQAYSGTELSREGNENSGMSSEYNDEDLSYPATSFGDGQGEASGDGGQFEVIEIDEEDEDVNAMFSGDQTLNPANSLSAATKNKMEQMPAYGSSTSASSFTVRPYRTARGKTGLILGNYYYTKEKVHAKNIHWRCQKRSCKARCTTSHQMECLNVGEVLHNHDPPITPSRPQPPDFYYKL